METEGETMEAPTDSGNDLKIIPKESNNSKEGDEKVEYNEEYNELLSQEKLTMKFKNTKDNKRDRRSGLFRFEVFHLKSHLYTRP